MPILTARDAARHLGMPDRTLDAWLAPADGSVLVHSVRADMRGGPRVPFVGVIEAFVLRGLREMGFTMARIRTAVDLVRKGFDDEHALASQRIDTDGAELFLRLADDDHVAVRDGQRPIEDVLTDFLKDVRWDDEGRPQLLRLERYAAGATVVIDPRFAWGAPVLEESRVPLRSVTEMWRARELHRRGRRVRPELRCRRGHLPSRRLSSSPTAISKDKNIRFRQHEISALTPDGYLFCLSTGKLDIEGQVDRFVRAAPAVERTVRSGRPGFWTIYSGGRIAHRWSSHGS